MQSIYKYVNNKALSNTSFDIITVWITNTGAVAIYISH